LTVNNEGSRRRHGQGGGVKEREGTSALIFERYAAVRSKETLARDTPRDRARRDAFIAIQKKKKTQSIKRTVREMWGGGVMRVAKFQWRKYAESLFEERLIHFLQALMPRGKERRGEERVIIRGNRLKARGRARPTAFLKGGRINPSHDVDARGKKCGKGKKVHHGFRWGRCNQNSKGGWAFDATGKHGWSRKSRSILKRVPPPNGRGNCEGSEKKGSGEIERRGRRPQSCGRQKSGRGSKKYPVAPAREGEKRQRKK